MERACLDEEVASKLARGELAGKEASDCELHLDACSDCQELVAILAQLATAEAPQEKASPGHASPGERIGRYSVTRELGRGATSVVYLARDLELERDVALKLMTVLAPAESMRASRLVHEARALAKLSHDNVVVVYEVGSHGQSVFIAMEYIEGQTLADWRAQSNPGADAILDAFAGAADGLSAAHEAGLVHRDVKPANIMVGTDGRVKVADFGLALAMNPDRDTPEEMWSGTPAYMAPEQFSGISDTRSDQYSFCVSLYEALSGELPFAGTTISEIRASAEAGEAQGTVRPTWLQPLLLRGMSAEPKARYASLRELMGAIQGRRKRPARLAVGVAAAVSLSAAALLGGVYGGSPPSSAKACTDREKPALNLWTDAKQEVARRAVLSATDDPYAPGAWIQIDRRVRTFATEWGSAATAVCEEAAGHPAKNAASGASTAVERKESCLRGSLRRAEALIATLSDAPSAPPAMRSVGALAKLESPSLCTKAENVRWQQPAAAQSEEVRKGLAALHALHDTRQDAAAAEKSVSVARDAKAVGDSDTQLTALLLGCAVEQRRGNAEAAEALCHNTAILASSMGRADQAGRAWALLAGSVGADAGRYAEAERWGQYAQANAEYAHSPSLEATVLNQLGVLAKQQGRYAEARRSYERALELHLDLFGPSDLRVASTIGNLGILSGVEGDRAKAAEQHLRAIATKENALGASHPDVALSRINLAVAESRQAPQAANALYREAMQTLETGLAASHPLHGVVRVNLANTERRLGNPEEAARLLADARERFSKLYGATHPRVVAVLENEALVLADQQRHEEALALHQRAHEARLGTLGPDHADTANSRSNIGLTLLALGRPREAESAFLEALRARRKALGEEHFDTSYDLYGLSRAQRALGKPAAAQASLEAALAIANSSESPDRELLADMQFALARQLVAKHGERARVFANRAQEGYLAMDGAAGESRAKDVASWLAAHAHDR